MLVWKNTSSYKEDPKEGRSNLDWFYGDSLDISYSSFGGWIPFGPEQL
jgi:hypothetical protein